MLHHTKANASVLWHSVRQPAAIIINLHYEVFFTLLQPDSDLSGFCVFECIVNGFLGDAVKMTCGGLDRKSVV